VNPADAPVMTLALTSDTISLRAMSDLADTILAQRLSQVPASAASSVQGGLKPAVRIQADLARLAAYGISMEDLRTRSRRQRLRPEGLARRRAAVLHHRRQRPDRGAEAYKPIIIAYRNGAPVTIGDVARSSTGWRTTKVGGWYQGTPAVIIDIQRQPGANVIEVVARSAPNCRGAARDPGRRQADHRQRPHRHHPRLGPRRAVHADAQRRAGGAGGAAVPAHAARHHHRRRGAAAVADRDLRRHVFSAASASTTCR
jgi:hypothetical protein